MQIVVCTDNSCTWRNSLTVGKQYTVLRLFNEMVEIKCDDEKIRTYRANRFS